MTDNAPVLGCRMRLLPIFSGLLIALSPLFAAPADTPPPLPKLIAQAVARDKATQQALQSMQYGQISQIEELDAKGQVERHQTLHLIVRPGAAQEIQVVSAQGDDLPSTRTRRSSRPRAGKSSGRSTISPSKNLVTASPSPTCAPACARDRKPIFSPLSRSLTSPTTTRRKKCSTSSTGKCGSAPATTPFSKRRHAGPARLRGVGFRTHLHARFPLFSCARPRVTSGRPGCRCRSRWMRRSLPSASARLSTWTISSRAGA